MTTSRIAQPLSRTELVRQLIQENHFKNDFFQVRRSAVAGLGAFATQDLLCGDVILKEEPLFASHGHRLFEDFEKLDDATKAVALSLSRNDELPRSTPPVEAVWETNR